MTWVQTQALGAGLSMPVRTGETVTLFFLSLVLNKAFKMSLARGCLCTLSFYTTINNLRYVNKLEPDLGTDFLVTNSLF